MDPAGRGRIQGRFEGFEDPSFEKIQRVQPGRGIRPAPDGQHYNDERSRETDLYWFRVIPLLVPGKNWILSRYGPPRLHHSLLCAPPRVPSRPPCSWFLYRACPFSSPVFREAPEAKILSRRRMAFFIAFRCIVSLFSFTSSVTRRFKLNNLAELLRR